MSDQTYQGYRNYPTWCINLWLNNEEGLYRHCLRLAQYNEDVSDLADVIEQFVEDNLLPELDGFPSDLLTWAFGQVDWYEIAESFLEE